MLQSYNDRESLQGIAFAVRKEAKKISARNLPYLECSARPDGKKETPSGLSSHLLTERAAGSADCDGLVKAINMTSLYVNSLSDNNVVCPRFEISSSTI